MSFLKNTLWLKRIIIFSSFIIVSLILWNTFVFFQKFKEEERAKIESYAAAIEELATRDLKASVSLPLKIIEQTNGIPLILVGEDGSINTWHHLDSIQALDSVYVENQLAKMKKQNKPIVMKSFDVTQYIYYRDSDLLNKLTYYPLALILILVLFLTIVYMVFKSNKIAEQNKLWTGMAKETAHQIGTPLSSLLGWIAILKMEKVGEKYVDEIEKDVYRLSAIAERFSKIGSVPELKKQNIIAISKTAFEYLKLRGSKQIQFSFSAPQEELYANANHELFGWVIENLIKNAIDAMQGKGALSLTIENSQKNINITLSDTGKGIRKKQFKQIFKPGFTTKKRGWGLGLSLSKRIIEDYHSGKIFVQKSEVNKGTSIQIQLKKIS
ncbi:MAG: HAMP domain-containing sensor histidine kinase [Polaribacter sp.]|nr:HAMP domain-containing sensor histidine kinase [Polaribacter sp.]